MNMFRKNAQSSLFKIDVDDLSIYLSILPATDYSRQQQKLIQSNPVIAERRDRGKAKQKTEKISLFSSLNTCPFGGNKSTGCHQLSTLLFTGT